MVVKLEGPNKYSIVFTNHEGNILNELYGSELSVAHGIGKIMGEWLKGRLTVHDDRERVKVYERFKNLSTDKQNEILAIMARE